VAPVSLPEKLEFSGDFTGMSGDFTALPENVPGLPEIRDATSSQTSAPPQSNILITPTGSLLLLRHPHSKAVAFTSLVEVSSPAKLLLLFWLSGIIFYETGKNKSSPETAKNLLSMAFGPNDAFTDRVRPF
jgi:hypothetical protein